MKALVGEKQEYFIKSGNYKSYTNGIGITVQLCIGETNKLYNKMSGSDTLYWFNANVNSDSVFNSELIKNKEKILGEDCDALVLTTKRGKQPTFFHQDIPLMSVNFRTIIMETGITIYQKQSLFH